MQNMKRKFKFILPLLCIASLGGQVQASENLNSREEEGKNSKVAIGIPQPLKEEIFLEDYLEENKTKIKNLIDNASVEEIVIHSPYGHPSFKKSREKRNKITRQMVNEYITNIEKELLSEDLKIKAANEIIDNIQQRNINLSKSQEEYNFNVITQFDIDIAQEMQNNFVDNVANKVASHFSKRIEEQFSPQMIRHEPFFPQLIKLYSAEEISQWHIKNVKTVLNNTARLEVYQMINNIKSRINNEIEQEISNIEQVENQFIKEYEGSLADIMRNKPNLKKLTFIGDFSLLIFAQISRGFIDDEIHLKLCELPQMKTFLNLTHIEMRGQVLGGTYCSFNPLITHGDYLEGLVLKIMAEKGNLVEYRTYESVSSFLPNGRFITALKEPHVWKVFSKNNKGEWGWTKENEN